MPQERDEEAPLAIFGVKSPPLNRRHPPDGPIGRQGKSSGGVLEGVGVQRDSQVVDLKAE